MPRWEPGARQRLEQAALDLFAERGYEQTTVAEIAAAAGLKERSFYRYFPDKREVLFAGDELEESLTAAIDAQPADLDPLPALLGALPAAGDVFRPREFLLRRQDVIAANPALGERGLIKLAVLSQALSAAIAARGVDARTAELCVGVGMTVLREATQRWIDGDGEFVGLLRETADLLAALIAPATSAETSTAKAPESPTAGRPESRPAPGG